MTLSPEISVILSTYERPEHLQRSLYSLALQQGVENQFEVVVADDGSTDRTREVVDWFAKTVDFPVRFTTHEHDGFRLARCRNEGVRATSAPYLLFSDADCLFPPDHLSRHLQARRPGVARAGDSIRLDQAATRRIDNVAVATGMFRHWASWQERQRIVVRRVKDIYYQAIRHRDKPRLIGCNIGVWRNDYEAVNGFDEQFVGWGCEDDDFALRLRQAGVQIRSIVGRTVAYHMWHPTDATQLAQWKDGSNVDYLCREIRRTRCIRGLVDESDWSAHSTDLRPEQCNV